MDNNFDLRKFLTENKLTQASKVLAEQRKPKRSRLLREGFAGKSDTSELEIAVADVTGEYLNVDNPEDQGKDLVWNVLGHEVRSLAVDDHYQGQDTVMIDGKRAYECPQKLVDRIAEMFNSNREGRARIESTDGLNEFLKEAGYTDDDEDLNIEDDDFIGATGSDYELGIEDDPKAREAAKRGMKAAGIDVNGDEDFEEPEDIAEPEDSEDSEDLETSDKYIPGSSSDSGHYNLPGKGSIEDFSELKSKDSETYEKIFGGEENADKDEWHRKGYWTLDYDPETVELNYIDDKDFQEEMNHYRRPKAAARYLQRYINSIQRALDDEDPEYGAKKTYLQLRDGIYFDYPFRRPDARVIATIRRHKNN